MSATQPEKHLDAHGADAAHGEHVGHIVPLWLLAATFGGLVVLTAVTYGVSLIDLGKLNLWVALIVAFTKASLVVLFFMHMKWDRPMNAVVFISSLLFVVLFIGFALTDSSEYQPQIIPGYAPKVHP